MSKEEASIEGFTLQCSDGEYVTVTSEQTAVLVSKCDFFRSVFAHGTTESSKRIIQKPDWSAQTASKLVGLLTVGETPSP